MRVDRAVMILMSKEESRRQNMETKTKKGGQNGTHKQNKVHLRSL